MPVRESLILQLHRDMLRHCERDERQRGSYKFGPNQVEARDADGRVVDVLFDPTPPHLTPKEMSELVGWLAWADQNGFKHPLVRIANFVFEYLAIHPFQDGNGRTSRLITNLLLLRHGYAFAWAQARDEATFTRREAAAALGFPLRTVEGIVARLLEMKRLERLGQGRATRYRVLP